MSSQNHDARALLLREKAAVLATLSAELDGFPFGSVVPYCLDPVGRPLILISDIAQHTRNILADSRIALTVADRAAVDVQVGARLTLVGRAAAVEGGEGPGASSESAERYYRHFPKSRGYHQTHGFALYRLEPVRFYYIGGFGDIRWIEPGELLVDNPFTAADERRIAEHMDEDHVPAMRHYCALAGIDPEGRDPVFAGIDAEGCDLRLGDAFLRIAFDRAVGTPEEARGELVRLARTPLAAEAAP